MEEIHFPTARVHHVLCSAYSDLMTNLADYDALEVSPVAQEDEPDGSTTCEVCSEEEADFWSVYAHCIEGGVICIGDFETLRRARWPRRTRTRFPSSWVCRSATGSAFRDV